MGGKASAKSTMEITQTAVNKSTKNILTKNQQTQDSTAVATNEMTFKDVDLRCQGNISQAAGVKLTSVASATSEQVADLRDQMKSELSSELDNQAEAKGGMFAFGAKAESETNTKLKNTMVNIVDQNVTTDTLNQIIQDINTKNSQGYTNLVIDPCGIAAAERIQAAYLESDSATTEGAADVAIAALGAVGDKECDIPCNFTQSLSVDLVSQQMTSTMMDAVSASEQITEAEAEVKASATATSGMGDFGAIIMIIIILCSIAGSAYLAFSMTPQGKAAQLVSSVAR